MERSARNGRQKGQEPKAKLVKIPARTKGKEKCSDKKAKYISTQQHHLHPHLQPHPAYPPAFALSHRPHPYPRPPVHRPSPHHRLYSQFPPHFCVEELPHVAESRLFLLLLRSSVP